MFKIANEKQLNILKRFRNVFDLAYKRYVDISNAEAQAREAQIEAALESVRSSSLAMHQSDQLKTVATVMFKKFTELGFTLTGAFIFLYNKETGNLQAWIATATLSEPVEINTPYSVAIAKNQIFKDEWSVFETGEEIFNRKYSGKTKDDFYRYVAAHNDYPEAVKDFQLEAESWIISIAGEKHCAVGFDSWNGQLATTEDYKILKRFSKVFEQAYVRFLDLQKAEAQARESQVQLALERVRARTMAMHHSNELAEISSILFQQIKELGFETWSCGFCTWKDDNILEAWMGADSGELLPPLLIPYKEEQTHYDVYEAFLQNKTAYYKIWEGDALQEHYAFLQTIPSVKVAIDQLKEAGEVLPLKQCYYAGFFKQGYLLVITKEPNEELKDISRRFASVFDLTYTRFLDLKKAEAQAREAQIEAALEKIRSRSLAMHRSNELKDVIAIMFKNQMN